MQNENNQNEHDVVERISDLMYKLELGCTKVEQCAFDSINTTDQVMMSLHAAMEMMQRVLGGQTELSNLIETCARSLSDEDRQSAMELMKEQEGYLSSLEDELQNMAASAMEANDAARCIDAGISEQSENISELLQFNEEIIHDHV